MKPRTCVIANIKWKIYWNKNCIEEHDAKGLCFKKEQEIWIESSLDEQTKRHVFLHELLHAICYSYGFRHKPRRNVEEELINMITPQLLHVFDDNPIVANYILGVSNENLSR